MATFWQGFSHPFTAVLEVNARGISSEEEQSTTNNNNNNKAPIIIQSSHTTMADTGIVLCKACNKTFSGNRYFMSHLKYKTNAKCKKLFQKVPTVQATQQKHTLKDIENTSNNPVLEQAGSVACKRVISTLACEFPVNHDDSSEDNTASGMMFDDDMRKLPSYNLKKPKLGPEPTKPTYDTSIRDDFHQYTEKAYKDFCELTAESRAGVELRAILQQARAPLHLYNKIFHWHLENSKAKTYINQKSLVKYLTERYNLSKSKPIVTAPLLLPHSQARVNLVVHSFKEQLASLLTDCRITDKDYLFFDNNPFKPPPEDWTHVSDINTGRAYRETYKQLIKNPDKEVLLPIIFYMDGAVTGQFDNLPIEALKFTLGIYNSKARNRKCTWRELGYVTKFLAEDTQGKDEIRASEHMDALGYLKEEDDSDSEESNSGQSNACETNKDASGEENAETVDLDSEEDDEDDIGKPIDTCAGQDLHAMLAKFLESYLEVEKAGVAWDLRYRGETHQVVFVPFVMFIKGDSVEHDKHCGSYTSRTQAVKHLCRYCCCPNELTDEPYKRYQLKNPKMIQDLIDAQDEEGLKAVSQQNIQNAWYLCRFGSHNILGIHGASPLELLHWLQLGKYKYQRQMFFAQSGKSSNLSKSINKLAVLMGIYYARQSDRDLPRTNFSKGIIKGKLMAGEMSGLILVLCTVLRCTKGRKLLLTESRGVQREFLGNLAKVKDWIMLLETMLQMEAWLKQPQIPVNEIQRFEVKVRELMNLEKQIGKRDTGMGFKTFNFHAAVHLADDMLNFGVPSNVNTDSNESHHKPDKTAAIRTQRRPETFDIQLAKQIHDTAVVSEGLHEISTGDQKWAYHRRVAEEEDAISQENEETVTNQPDDLSTVCMEPTAEDIRNTGVKCRFFYDDDSQNWVYRVKSRMKDKNKFKLEPALINMLSNVANELGNGISELHLFTEHKRFDQIFRASPRYLGKPWRDWVMIDWGDALILPGQVWIFVDLRKIPVDLVYEPGIYAIVESANQVTNQEELDLSQIFRPYLKETAGVINGSVQRRFYLVDVESFYAPCCMIPDHGNPDSRAYLRLTPKKEWASQFGDWLKSSHARQFPR